MNNYKNTTTTTTTAEHGYTISSPWAILPASGEQIVMSPSLKGNNYIVCQSSGYHKGFGFCGTESLYFFPGDSLWHHNGERFSTLDVENDISTQHNCARYRYGAWWYSNCGQSNLNGAYHSTASSPSETGIFWYHWHGWRYSLQATTMMIQNKTG